MIVQKRNASQFTQLLRVTVEMTTNDFYGFNIEPRADGIFDKPVYRYLQIVMTLYGIPKELRYRSIPLKKKHVFIEKIIDILRNFSMYKPGFYYRTRMTHILCKS